MELKPGYKQTEVGAIPEEWKVKLLPEVCRFRGGKAHEQHISEVGRFVCVNSKFISTDGKVRKYSTANFCCAKQNDVLMVMSDLPSGRALAKAYLVEQDDLYAVNQRVCALTAYRDCPKYLLYILNRNPYFLKFDDGVNQTHLLNNVFRNCPLPIPPKVAEQEAIAEALSDVDALLGALDQLIAKKRDLKQAAMQQLLTGQTRLPGFSGKWEIHALGESITLLSGHHVLAQYCNSRGVGVPYLTGPADFPNGKIQHTKFTERPTTLCAPDDILVTVKGSGSGSLIVADGAYCISRQLMAIRVRDWPGQFIYYSLLQNASKIKAASTGLIPGLSRSDILEQTLPLPSDFSEQNAIAEVLSDMDAELAALTQRRDKTRSLKQGMMQELLTGRTRLV